MRTTPRRRRYGALATLAASTVTAGVLATGCGGDGDGGKPRGGGAVEGLPGPGEVLLQAVSAHGPAPFTPSTVRPSPDAPGSPPSAEPGTAPATGIVSGATPGLYGGARSVASCDVARQTRLLTSDDAKAAAFAQAAGVAHTRLADWLDGLTPVVLRSDTRVTGHGYRDGSAADFQAVLQAGTAVLVDEYGAPRVRCASGSPLRSPVPEEGAVEHKGQPWPGFDPGRVVTVNATHHVVDSLFIVSVVSNTLIERKAGTEGEQDRIVTDESVLAAARSPESATSPSAAPQPAAPQPPAPEPAAPQPPAPEPAAPQPAAPEPLDPGPEPEPEPEAEAEAETEFQAGGGAPQDAGEDEGVQGQEADQDQSHLMGPDNAAVEPEPHEG
ncbi:DUF6777 domain-containing protein [Streptomyces sp. NPDC045431]|uniref:DUF6777 domain-containing protein n=1 Tax=Streptomyces sp. NPDC045431 TaxID=3155613 RepID=UPI003408F5B2